MSHRAAPQSHHSQSTEQRLLHTMLHDRDAQISHLLSQLHAISDDITSLQKELHAKSQRRRRQREEHSNAIQRLKEEHAERRKSLARYESDVKSGGGLRVHEYAALMKAANGSVESSYVVRLQARLCRAMHSLGVMESQLALVKENCSSLIKCMKEDLSHMVDDRTRREIELMNTLASVDAEKRAWQHEMEKKLREQEDLLDSVRDEYEELGLEYDEDEVRRALEVQMLREQIERVKRERVQGERELLASLLEREESIERVRGEIEGLGVRGGLKGENSGGGGAGGGEKSLSSAVGKEGEEVADTGGERTAVASPLVDELKESEEAPLAVSNSAVGKEGEEGADSSGERTAVVSPLVDEMEDEANEEEESPTTFPSEEAPAPDSASGKDGDVQPTASDEGVDASVSAAAAPDDHGKEVGGESVDASSKPDVTQVSPAVAQVNEASNKSSQAADEATSEEQVGQTSSDLKDHEKVELAPADDAQESPAVSELTSKLEDATIKEPEVSDTEADNAAKDEQNAEERPESHDASDEQDGLVNDDVTTSDLEIADDQRVSAKPESVEADDGKAPSENIVEEAKESPSEAETPKGTNQKADQTADNVTDEVKEATSEKIPREIPERESAPIAEKTTQENNSEDAELVPAAPTESAAEQPAEAETAGEEPTNESGDGAHIQKDAAGSDETGDR